MLHDPRGSSESRKSELVAERERVREEVQKKEEDLEGKVERTNNLYFEILQQVRGDEPRRSSSTLSLCFIIVQGLKLCEVTQHLSLPVNHGGGMTAGWFCIN